MNEYMIESFGFGIPSKPKSESLGMPPLCRIERDKLEKRQTLRMYAFHSFQISNSMNERGCAEIFDSRVVQKLSLTKNTECKP